MNIEINSQYPLAESIGFEIQERPIYNADGNKIDNWKEIINGETGAVLNVARESYTPTANDRLIEMAEGIQESTPFNVEGYAVFQGGKKVLAYLKNPAPPRIAGQQAQDFLVIGNSHDGSTALFSGFTSYVYRCENMFSRANQQIRILHRKNHDRDIEEAEKYINLYYNEQTGVYEQLNELQAYKTNNHLKGDFIREMLELPASFDPMNYESREVLHGRKRNQLEALESSINHETYALGDNLFGLFNGATRYTTHELKQRGNVFGNVFGNANKLNEKAFNFVTRRAKEMERPQLVTVNIDPKPEPPKEDPVF